MTRAGNRKSDQTEPFLGQSVQRRTQTSERVTTRSTGGVTDNLGESRQASLGGDVGLGHREEPSI